MLETSAVDEQQGAVIPARAARRIALFDGLAKWPGFAGSRMTSHAAVNGEPPDGENEPRDPSRDAELRDRGLDAQTGVPPDMPPPAEPVAQGFFDPPPERAAIYAKLQEVTGGTLDEQAMAMCYEALSAVDEGKLWVAIQALLASNALNFFNGTNLAAFLAYPKPRELPAGVRPPNTVLLFQLKCFFFYPGAPASNLDDQSLVKDILRWGMESPRADKNAECIASLLIGGELGGGAEIRTGLLEVKKMIDAASEGPGGQPPRSREPAQDSMMPALAGHGFKLPAEDRRAILTRLRAMAPADWRTTELETLCYALCAIDNPAMIDVAVRIHQASVALHAKGMLSLKNMFERGVSDRVFNTTLEYALGEQQDMTPAALERIKAAVLMVRHWHYPFRKPVVRMTSDEVLLTDIVMLAQKLAVANFKPHVIVSALKRMEDPTDLLAMQGVVEMAIKMNRHGISNAEWELTADRYERLKMLKEHGFQW